MKYRPLGASGLMVSELCLGTMVFGETGARGTDAKAAEVIIHTFLEAGGNHIDTADVYAGGRSEEIVGKALKNHRERVVLATKVRFSMGEEPNQQGLSRLHIQQGVEASLRRLDTDVIDLLYAHCWDPLTPLEETMRAFDDLVRAGKVRYIGVSNFKAWQLMKALDVSASHNWVGFVAAQYQYSLVERNIEHEIGDLCATHGVGLTPWSPLGGGFLSGKYHPGDKPADGRLAVMPDETEEAWHRRATERNWNILETVEEVTGAHRASHSQVALAWLLRQPAVSSVIMGVRTLEQLQDNLAGSQVALTEQELAHLDEVSRPEEPYPYRFIEHYGARDPNPEI